jgi:hypothetical protein
VVAKAKDDPNTTAKSCWKELIKVSACTSKFSGEKAGAPKNRSDGVYWQVAGHRRKVARKVSSRSTQVL